jgi:hypothetical protein
VAAACVPACLIEARLDYCSWFVHYFGVAGRWTNDDYFRFDIALGLMRARVRGVRRLFTEEERERIARTIVEHLRRSRWHWWREEGSVEPGYMARMPVRTDGEPSDGEARQ